MADVARATFDAFSEGGLLDDADVLVKSARFVKWDYNGGIAPPGALFVKLVMQDEGDGKEHVDHISSGELTFFVPSDDGKLAVPVGKAKMLNKNTNAVLFILSLFQADTRGDLTARMKESGDISMIEGLRFHLMRKPQPKRAGIIQAPTMAGQPTDEREKKYISVEKINSYPGEVATAAAPVQAHVAAAAPVAAPAAAPAAAGGANDVAVAVLYSILGNNGNRIARTQIAGKVFSNEVAATFPMPTRNAALGLMVKPEWLGTLAPMGINFDAGSDTVSIV